MPGKNKPTSEYKKRFRWHESQLATSFKSIAEQKMPSAGIASATVGRVTKDSEEPALQQRRKPLDNDVKRTYTTSHFYNPAASSSNGHVHQLKSPSSKPLTQHQKTTKLSLPINGHKERHRSSPGRGHGDARILVKNDQNKRRTSGPKDDKHKTYSKLTNGHHPKERMLNVATSNGRPSSGGSKSKDGHRSSNDSGKSNKKPHDVDAALQYQAGVRARPLGPRYLSEYQRQFAWKHAPVQSPLIAAEELIHKSNTNLAPFDPAKIPKKTEYNAQFKAYYPPAPSHQQLLQENVEREMKAKYKVKTKSKKSKKNHISPEQMKMAGKPSVVIHEPPSPLKESQNPQKPFFPHAQVRKWKSEYHSNFRAPSVFSYEDGVWKGAKPPHLNPQESTSGESDKQGGLKHSKSEGDIPSWFAEVLELRSRAQEYQKRAQGTHFSRDRLVQLWTEGARQAADDSSTAVSTSSLTTSSDTQQGDGRPSSARATDGGSTHKTSSSGHMTGGMQQNGRSDRNIKSAPTRTSPARRKLAWNEGKKGGTDGVDRRSSYGSIPTPEGYRASASGSSDDFTVLSGDGRLPTPTLGGQQTRHHLDKTTPAIGGAILTSPPRRVESGLPARAATVPSHLTPSTQGPRTPHRTPPQHRTSLPDRTPGLVQGSLPQPRNNGHRQQGSGGADARNHQTNGHFQQTNRRDPAPTKSMPGRVTTILPGGVSKAFQYDSDEEDEASTPLHSSDEGGTHDRTLTPPRTPPKDQNDNRNLQSLNTSPTAGKITKDPDPLSPGPTLRFQRHSNHFFETQPNLPRTWDDHEPSSKTWAEPRRSQPQRPRPSGREYTEQDGNKNSRETNNLNKGPLNRPNSGSMHGRPLTAHPQTRENAARESTHHRVSTPEEPLEALPSRPSARNGPADGHRGEPDSDELSISSMSTSSSVSLASEVLDRAKKRRDDFWGKKM